jgi:P4 family phage/plasmid primase-like protien
MNLQPAAGHCKDGLRGRKTPPGGPPAPPGTTGQVYPASEVAGWLRLLAPEVDQVVELRALEVRHNRERSHTEAGFFDVAHLHEMARQALQVTKHAKGVYFTLNPLNTALLARRANRIDWAQQGEQAADKDALRRRWVLIDCDPVRIANVSSTDEEKEQAWVVVLAVRSFLSEQGWPDPILADSGNGYHLLYRIDLPADDGGLINRVLQALAARFDNERVTIDQTVFNPSRICRVPGTLARKGDSTSDRPHRRARFIEVPGCADPADVSGARLVPVPIELLQALVAEAKQDPPVAPPSAASSADGRYESRLKVGEWLRDRGVGFREKEETDSKGRKVYILDKCPFDDSHVGDSCITQEPGGKPGASCFHNSCRGKRWKEFVAQIGRPEPHHYDPPLQPRKPRSKSTDRRKQTAQVNEAADDPHRLARLFLADHHANGLLTLRWWREEWFRWDGGAYRPVADKELRAELTTRIKTDFDRRNREAIGGWDGNGKKPEARKVTGRLVSDTAGALASMAVLPGSREAPFSLNDAPPFPADEALACQNVLLHLPAVARGKPVTHPPTPAFFSVNALGYDYDPHAPLPTAWFDFLSRVWPDDSDAINTLQEWFGYCLLPDTSQHKILLIVGPKRSGKGTIARVLRAVVGEANTVAPTLAGLGTEFGLAPLLGKSLAVIADARLSGRSDAAVVVERLLSVSGEDAQTVNRKYLAPITTTLRTRFMILTNELPRLNDPSGAIVSRLVVLRQKLSWYGKEDTTLTGRLLAELPGILLWAIEGWQRLRERGRFQQPESGRKLITDLEDLSSPIGAFVRECCDVGHGLEVEVKQLFTAWQRWCERKGRKEPGTEQNFGRELRAAVPHIDDSRPRRQGERVRLYVGINVRPPNVFGDETEA